MPEASIYNINRVHVSSSAFDHQSLRYETYLVMVGRIIKFDLRYEAYQVMVGGVSGDGRRHHQVAMYDI